MFRNSMFLILTILCLCMLSFWLVIGCGDDDDDTSNNPTATPTPVATPTPTPEVTVVRLTEDEPYEMHLSLWPDSSKLLFVHKRDNLHWDLYSVPLDGSKNKMLLSPGDNTYFYVDLNPAGTHICYATGPTNNDAFEIGILEIGGEETIITNNAQTNGRDSLLPVFHGSGEKMAYVQRDYTNQIDRIFTMSLTGDNEQEIITLPTGQAAFVDRMDWVGSTNELIYNNLAGTLFRLEAVPGSTPVAYYPESDFHVCKSNLSGTKILCSEAVGSHQQIVVMNSDGTGKTVVVSLEDFPMFQEIYSQICWLNDDSGLIDLALEPGDETMDLYLFNDLF